VVVIVIMVVVMSLGFFGVVFLFSVSTLKKNTTAWKA